MKKSDQSLAVLRGQILGLRAFVTTILSSNPNIKLDHHNIGKVISETPIAGTPDEDVQIRTEAREFVHDIANDVVG